MHVLYMGMSKETIRYSTLLDVWHFAERCAVLFSNVFASRLYQQAFTVFALVSLHGSQQADIASKGSTAPPIPRESDTLSSLPALLSCFNPRSPIGNASFVISKDLLPVFLFTWLKHVWILRIVVLRIMHSRRRLFFQTDCLRLTRVSRPDLEACPTSTGNIGAILPRATIELRPQVQGSILH
jgi:hypothetical protein